MPEARAETDVFAHEVETALNRHTHWTEGRALHDAVSAALAHYRAGGEPIYPPAKGADDA